MEPNPVLPPPPVRVAGLCYLAVIAGGIFAQLLVREPLVVFGDARATLANIAAHETLWRWGIAVHALYLVAAAAAGVILYRLFRPVHATLALLALALTLADVTMEGVLLAGLYVPLTTMRDGAFDALPPAQREALGYLGVRVFFIGWSVALLLFAGFCAITGWLIFRSRLLPRAIGGLMIAAGAAYLVNSLAFILSPELSRSLQPWILLPPFVGELSLAGWLAVRGGRG